LWTYLSVFMASLYVRIGQFTIAYPISYCNQYKQSDDLTIPMH